MKTSIKLKDGSEWYLMYSYMNDHLLEISPFQQEVYDKRNYLPDGEYELSKGRMVIKDHKIIYINEE